MVTAAGAASCGSYSAAQRDGRGDEPAPGRCACRRQDRRSSTRSPTRSGASTSLQDDEYQMLWLVQLCNDHEAGHARTRVRREGQLHAEPVHQGAAAVLDPNEKSGTQGGGACTPCARTSRSTTGSASRTCRPRARRRRPCRVTDPLDPAKVDLSTFALGSDRLRGRAAATPPSGVDGPGRRTVDLRPAKDLLVQVEAGLQAVSGGDVDFTSLDPADAGARPPTRGRASCRRT